MRHRVLLATIFASLTVACADPSLDGGDDEEVAAGKNDKTTAFPEGEFKAETDADIGDFFSLTLSPDRTFSRRFKVIDCLPASACAPEVGRYKFTLSTTSDARYIRFYDADGDAMDRYGYTFAGGVLRLRLDRDTRFFSMRPVGPQVVELSGDERGRAVALFDRLAVPARAVQGVCSESEIDVTSRVRGFNPARWTATVDGAEAELEGEEISFAVALFSRAGVPATSSDSITLVSSATLASRVCELSPARWTLSFRR
jgi:hypothetical protein